MIDRAFAITSACWVVTCDVLLFRNCEGYDLTYILKSFMYQTGDNEEANLPSFLLLSLAC